jgi:GNAT superfamily N-acetyltransferase
LTVYNNAWTTHDGFKALTMDKALKIIRSMKDAIDPDIFIFAFYNENAIGFFVNLPELNQIFKDFNGNLNLLAKLKFLYHKWKKTPNTMYGLAFGVSKQFQGKGVEGAMIKFAEETILPKKIYNDIIMTWIGDFNTKMLKVVENLGAKKYRTFATYRKIFDTNAYFERYQLTNSQKQEK